MKFVRNATPEGLTAEGWLAAHKADRLHLKATGREVEITSTTDGHHSALRSGHYRGDAIDIRIWYLSDKEAFAEQLKKDLGQHYIVILESHHIHVHWSPVYEPV